MCLDTLFMWQSYLVCNLESLHAIANFCVIPIPFLCWDFHFNRLPMPCQRDRACWANSLCTHRNRIGELLRHHELLKCHYFWCCNDWAFNSACNSLCACLCCPLKSIASFPCLRSISDVPAMMRWKMILASMICVSMDTSHCDLPVFLIDFYH